MEKIISDSQILAQDFLTYVDLGVSPYHATTESVKRLVEQGFASLDETESWVGKIKAGGKYVLSRGGSAIIAFTVGKNFNPDTTNFKIIGTHTDSPCIRLAPNSDHTANGFQQACIQTYGGGLWHTWLDRDLSIGGRVVIKQEGKLVYKLYKSDGAIAIIPNLCIHLGDTSGNELKFNKETQLRPIFSTTVVDDNTNQSEEECKNHYKGLFADIAKKLGCKIEEIIDFDLCFSDANPSAIVGLNKEFIAAPRIDNLFSSWAAIRIMGEDKSFETSKDINVVACFDHEEIGSNTVTGADSQILPSILERVYNSLAGDVATHDKLYAAFRRSFLISADMAHGIHPNYPSKHQKNHQVKPNQGVVLKINANNRYATNALSGSIAKVVAEAASVPLQPFIVRADSRCGSTIGPMLSSRMGIAAIDVGCCQFAMHSIRESCGVLDCHYYTKFFKTFWDNEIPVIQQ